MKTDTRQYLGWAMRFRLFGRILGLTGIAGIVKITRAAYPDETAFDRTNAHFDADSTRENPRWYVVDVRLERKFARVLTLEKLKHHAASSLKSLPLLKRGNRLSVMPIAEREWNFILTLE